MAKEWVSNMQPKHEHWTYDETTGAMQSMGYNCDKIDYYIVSNMMYNDHYDIVKDDEELALKMAYHWLKDEDAYHNPKKKLLGEKNGSNKLTEKQVKEIYLSKLSLKTLSKIYGVSTSNISYIKNKKQWQWLTDTLD